MVETHGGRAVPKKEAAPKKDNKVKKQPTPAKPKKKADEKPATRTFCVMASSVGFEGGNYRSSIPSAGAKKAVSKIFYKLMNDKAYSKHKNVKTVKFILRAKGSKPVKTYAYQATQKKLATPKKFKRGDKEIVILYEYTVKSVTMSATEVKKMTGGELDVPIDALDDNNTGEDVIEDDIDEGVIEDEVDIGDTEDIEEPVDDLDGVDTEAEEPVEEGDEQDGGGRRRKKAPSKKKTGKGNGKGKAR